MHSVFYFYTTVTTYYYSTQEIFMLAWPTGTCVVYGTYSRYTTYITLWSCHCCVIVLLPQGPAKVRCVSNGDLKKNCELVLINSYNEKNNVLLFQKATENSFKICHIFHKIVPIRTIHKCFLHINIFVEMKCLIWCYFSWEKNHDHTRRWIWIYKVYIIVVVINYVKMAC